MPRVCVTSGGSVRHGGVGTLEPPTASLSLRYVSGRANITQSVATVFQGVFQGHGVRAAFTGQHTRICCARLPRYMPDHDSLLQGQPRQRTGLRGSCAVTNWLAAQWLDTVTCACHAVVHLIRPVNGPISSKPPTLYHGIPWESASCCQNTSSPLAACLLTSGCCSHPVQARCAHHGKGGEAGLQRTACSLSPCIS